MEQDFWGNIVGKFGLSPQLVGWYPLQKPGSQVPPMHPMALADIYGRLRTLDPRHPVCLALDSISRLEPYAPWCDVIMPWTEPEPAGDLRSVDVMLQRAMIVAAEPTASSTTPTVCRKAATSASTRSHATPRSYGRWCGGWEWNSRR